MEKRIALKHRQGLQCVVAGARDLLEHGAGLAVDEDYVHGLGSGLFFGYMKMADFSAMGAATDNLLENLAATLSARLVIEESDQSDWPQLKELIDSDQPVLVETSYDLVARYAGGYGSAIAGRTLAEAQQQAESTMNTQMGRHFLVVTGYDDERNLIFCVDNKLTLEIPIDVFMQSRTRRSDDALFYADRNRIIYFLLPRTLEDLPYRTVLSIRRTVDYWFNYPEHPRALADRYTRRKLGVPSVYNNAEALVRFREDFPYLGVNHDAAHVQQSLYFVTQIVARSSGPDMLRGMYARFLARAAEVTGLASLKESAADYAELAREWRQFFRYLQQHGRQIAAAPGSHEVIEGLAGQVERLAAREERAIGRLAAVTLKW